MRHLTLLALPTITALLALAAPASAQTTATDEGEVPRFFTDGLVE